MWECDTWHRDDFPPVAEGMKNVSIEVEVQLENRKIVPAIYARLDGRWYLAEEGMLEIVDIRDATEKEIKEYTRKQERPEWQQRMMRVFLHRPKCRPDCFGAAAGDCERCG